MTEDGEPVHNPAQAALSDGNFSQKFASRQPMKTILIAPNAFKDSLSAQQAASAIQQGILSCAEDESVECRLCPLADGGDNFLDVLCGVDSDSLQTAEVEDPLGRIVQARWGVTRGGRTAVIESACANGLRLLTKHERNPMETSTAGVGSLILRALNRLEVEHIVIGVGGSATNDGGAGMAQKLGVRFSPHRDLLRGKDLKSLRSADFSGLHPRLQSSEEGRTVQVRVACDVDNPLFGPQGAAHIFAAQKGADALMVEELDHGLRHFADLLGQRGLAQTPGMGAAGGLAFGLAVFCAAELVPGCRLVMETLDFRRQLEGVDLLITGEGEINSQSLRGKVPVEAARLAAERGIPTVALAGRKGSGWESCLGPGLLSDCFSIMDGAVSAEESMTNAAVHLSRLAADCFPRLFGRSR
jgi:glycerate kinase